MTDKIIHPIQDNIEEEITLELPKESPRIDKETKPTPSYYECDGNYTIFEDTPTNETT